jgi:hypothetical protein
MKCDLVNCPGDHGPAPEPCAPEAHTFAPLNQFGTWICTTCGWPGHQKLWRKGGPVLANKQLVDRNRTRALCRYRHPPPAEEPSVPVETLLPGVPAYARDAEDKAALRRARLGNSDARLDPLDVQDLEDTYT